MNKIYKIIWSRINVLLSFVEYMEDRWKRQPAKKDICKACNIIAWNLWQMDGLTGLLPFRTLKVEETNMFDLGFDDTEPVDDTPCECRVYDWRGNKSLTFNSIKRGNS